MRTVLTSKIDGFDIIDGFGEGVPDPEATKSALVDIIPLEPEAVALAAKKDEINVIWGKVRATKKASNSMSVEINQLKENKPLIDLSGAHKSSIQDLKNQQKVEYEKYRTHMAEITVKESELIPIHKVLEIKIEELRVSEAVYFEPKQGEFLESDLAVTIKDLKTKYPIPSGKLLALDGTLVDDLRGVIYWEKDVEWVATQILQIGVSIPSGAIRQDDLTVIQKDEIELQFESVRVADLTTAEKLAEKTVALDRAAIESTRLFNQYTIQATADPLAESQAWLALENEKIEVKYA